MTEKSQLFSESSNLCLLHLYGSNSMGTHMKTTVELNDALLHEAKRVARQEGVPLRALLEAALRHELERRAEPTAFTLWDASVGGQGLQREVADADWATLRDAAYEGRGA